MYYYELKIIKKCYFLNKKLGKTLLNMKRFLTLIALTILILLVYISCDKCKSDELGFIEFTTADHAIVPYTGNETLVFKDSLTNQLDFNSGSRTSIYEIPRYENPDPSVSCHGDVYYVEGNYTEFSAGFPYGISLYLTYGDPFADPIKKYIFIKVFFSDTSEKWYFGCKFEFNDLLLSNTESSSGNILVHSDTLLLGTHEYYSVYTLRQNSVSSDYDNLQYLYYNTAQGILGFKTVDGHLWCLSEE